MNAPGKNLLKVCGILFIISGAISIIAGIGSVFIVNTWDSLSLSVLQVYEQTNITKSSLAVSAVLSMIQGILFLVTGIIGIKNCNRPEKANTCMVLAIVTIVLILASAVYSTITGQLAIVSVIIWLVIPLLFLWGALKNRQTEQNELT